jgi:mRNA interferase MazF
VRGDVHQLKAPRGVMGREQGGARYAVVVQSDDLFSSTLIVAPTSASARDMDHRPRVTIKGGWTNVLVEQIMAVDPARLGDMVGRLSYSEMQQIDTALRRAMHL